MSEGEKQYRFITESLPIHFAAVDESGNLFFGTNIPSRCLDIPRKSCFEKSPLDIDAPECRDRIEYTMRELLEKKHLIFERLHVRKNGLKVPVEISSHIYSYNGQNLILSIARDITERKLMQKVEIEAFRQIEKNIASSA
jgi:PAS domain S-box-containing protein